MKLLNSILFASLLLGSIAVNAEIAVIVHPSNNNTLTETDLTRMFLGKMKSFPSGESAVPVNMPEGDATTDEFNQKVLSKSASQLKAYWSKLVFTGKGTPPKDVASAEEMLKLVSSNPSLIGYIDASKVDASVKVIAKF
ncbi:MAG: phosphate ABC transporter substrate-binding protein [Gammaproteobacteria bacterium]|nr:phosphate ABC transporter substrate-binding protein [Gammaproteobacteria bacterium]NVK87463.1 phosphate ABC transporter substrate-binding protein [Gammaproteobacteria bacterium]